MRTTVGHLAGQLGISATRTRDLFRLGMPRSAAAARRWLQHRDREHAKRSGARQGQQNAKERKLAAEARLAEIDAAKAEGQLVSIDDFEVELSGMLEQLRARLLAAKQKWAPRIVGLRSIPEALVALDPCIEELMVACTRVADVIEAGEHVSHDRSRRLHPPRRTRRTS